ncbi:MAG: ABC transporter substrate-binding protein [Thermodesulfobacteriota bacterium]|nr:ABC transporter substrate-binding protein [Thermodesulfobacteriota bacterium]
MTILTKRKINIFKFFVFTFLSITLMACIKESRPAGKTIVIGLESNPTNLDPRHATDANSYRLAQLLYNPLIKMDSQFHPVPDITKRFTQPDDTTYLFHLKEGIQFHDGKELTCKDVKYTFDCILNPALKSPHFGAFEKIDSIVCINKYSVQFILKEPFAPFLINLAVIGIIPKDDMQKSEGSSHSAPVGTGPFKLAEFLHDERIVLHANTDYFDGRPKLERITFKIIPDSTVRLLELSQGNVHLLQNNIPPDLFPFLEKKEALKIVKRPGTTYSYIGFNLKDSILKDRRVREAIAYAIDRESIIRYILKGLALPASGILSPVNWAYEGNVKVYEYNNEKARDLLDQAGFIDTDGKGPQMRFELTFKTSTDQLRKRIAEIIQQQLKEVGIKINIQSYEWGTFYSDIKSGNFQLYTLSWVGITDPDVLYYIFHSSNIPPHGANRGRYINKRVDRLIEEGRITLDMNRRAKIYSEIQKILALEVPYVSLWYSTNVAVMNRAIHGYVVYPAGDFFSLKDVWIEND